MRSERDFIVRSIHLLVTIPAIMLNSVLLYCMFKRKIRNNGSFGVMIKFHCFFDLISSIVGFLSMVRLIPSGWSAIFISYGPCSLISSSTCFFSFALFLYSDTIATYITLFSFIARLCIIKFNSLSRGRAFFLLSCCFPLPTTMLAVLIFSASPENEIRGLLASIYPIDGIKLGVSGVMDLRTIRLQIVLFILCGLIFPFYAVLLFVRRMILQLLLQTILTASTRTIEVHRTFVQMLTFQAGLPIVLLATVISFLIGLFDLVHSPNIESATMIFAELVPICSPLIVFCHIPVYRREVMRLFPPLGTVSAVNDISGGSSMKLR